MPNPLVLVFILIWLVVAALVLQWGFTYNWSYSNLQVILLLLFTAVTIGTAAVVLYKRKS
jgi:hypothetical protein